MIYYCHPTVDNDKSYMFETFVQISNDNYPLLFLYIVNKKEIFCGTKSGTVKWPLATLACCTRVETSFYNTRRVSHILSY